jgi:hypothetical protein
VGAFIRTVDTILNATAAHVALVHHIPADGSNRLRGHSSLLGALDMTARVDKGAGAIASTLTTIKANDGPEGERIAFTTASIELYRDPQTGITTKAPVIKPADELPQAESAPKLTPNLRTMFSILHAIPPGRVALKI